MSKLDIAIALCCPTFVIAVTIDLINACGGWSQFTDLYAKCML